MPGSRGLAPRCRSPSAQRAGKRRRCQAVSWIRLRPGTSAASFSARRRPRTLPGAASRSRPARLTDTATLGRWASTASEPSAFGSAAPTARRCQVSSGASPRRRSYDAFARTGKLPMPPPTAPRGALVAAAGKLPPPLKRFRAGVLAGEAAEPQLRIMFPPNNARLELANDGSGKPDPIALKVTGGTGPLTVLVNGAPLPSAAGRRTLFFEPEGPGFVRLTVIDGRGATDSVVVRLQ